MVACLRWSGTRPTWLTRNWTGVVLEMGMCEGASEDQHVRYNVDIRSPIKGGLVEVDSIVEQRDSAIECLDISATESAEPVCR